MLVSAKGGCRWSLRS